MVGNPAKTLRFRFNEEVIDKLLKICWWNYDDKIIKKLEPVFSKSEISMDAILELEDFLLKGKYNEEI